MIYGGQVILVHLDILEPAQILCIVHWCIASPNQVMLTELLTLHMHGIAKGGSGGQVSASMHGCQVAARWKLIFFQKFEFEKRGYFGTTKKSCIGLVKKCVSAAAPIGQL